MEVALGIDIGGTKIRAGRISDTGEVLAHAEVATPKGVDSEAVLEAVTGVAGKVRQGGEVVCGVAAPGPMTETGERISPLNIPVWRDFPIRRRLEAALGLPAFLDGDAKALTLAEAWVGSARGEQAFVAMVVSTGIGGGIMLDGRILDGAAGNAGHIGHVIAEPDGRPCVCGASGCLEAEASGTAIAATTGRPASEADESARERTGRLVGRVVASVANLLDLRLAVVSGSVAHGFGDTFFRAAQREVDRQARLSFSEGTKVVESSLHNLGGLIGAAAVGWRGVARLPLSKR